MRNIGLTCTAFFLLTLPLNAQGPMTGQPSPERLDLLLKAWEQKMQTIDNFSTKVTRTDIHPLTKRATTLIGEAAFMKPDLARIDLTPEQDFDKKDADKSYFERMIFTGRALYEYSARDKKIIVHEVPKADPAADHMILSFLRGMKAEDARRRFNLTLTKESEWYAYVYISPKAKTDVAEFMAAQLTIYIKNPNPSNAPNLVMMPCRLWYKTPQGNEITYMFGNMQPNGNVNKASFTPHQVPGFTVEYANQAPKAPATPPAQTPSVPPR